MRRSMDEIYMAIGESDPDSDEGFPRCDSRRAGRGQIIFACPYGCVTECRRQYLAERYAIEPQSPEYP